MVALIDPSLFEGALQQAAADLQSAKANVAAVEANLEKAKASLVQTDADYKRQSALAQSGAQSQQTVELAKANFEVAKSSVTAAEAAIEQAKAQVKQKEAAVAVAKTNLAYTTIRSPIDGIVVARNVDVGQTVAASLQAPTIFNIAQDLTKMQLYAKTDESDVGRIKLGQDVTFKVDAYPKDVFHGTVSQKRMNATTVQNVVTYDTIIDFNNGELKLFPGMTAYVTIPVATVTEQPESPQYRAAVPAAAPTRGIPGALRKIRHRRGFETGAAIRCGEFIGAGGRARNRGGVEAPRRQDSRTGPDRDRDHGPCLHGCRGRHQRRCESRR